MLKLKLHRVQRDLAVSLVFKRFPKRFFTAIQCIAPNRMSARCALKSDLMHAARFEFDSQLRHALLQGLDLVVQNGLLCVRGVG